MPIFKKNFVSPKMAAILNFRIFRKIAKHKNAYISKTVPVLHILDTILVHCILHVLGTILVHCLV